VRSRALAASALALLLGLAACGRYGPPVRRAPEDRPRTASPQPEPAPDRAQEPQP
jgi:predicted small lipoprotein YifL